MFSFINSIKSNIKNISLNVINIILTTTVLIYLVSIYGFDHINKELLINFLTGAGFIILLIMITALTIAFTLYGAFKIASKKLVNNLDSIIKVLQENKDKMYEE